MSLSLNLVFPPKLQKHLLISRAKKFYINNQNAKENTLKGSVEVGDQRILLQLCFLQICRSSRNFLSRNTKLLERAHKCSNEQACARTRFELVCFIRYIRASLML